MKIAHDPINSLELMLGEREGEQGTFVITGMKMPFNLVKEIYVAGLKIDFLKF